MAKKPIRYCIVDAFTESAFKGNPAAVCLLEEEERDEEWLLKVAREFNMPITCYLTRFSDSPNTFHIRWFTSVAEVPICGHATLAASHFLFKYELVKTSVIEFISLSGTLTAKKVPDLWKPSNKINGSSDVHFLIELDFPVIPIRKYDATTAAPTLSTICKSLNVSSAAVTDIHKTITENDILVVLESAEAVIQVEPDLDEIRKFPGKGIIITGVAPTHSKFDFATRFFTPKMGVDEDYVCGSAHCALAPYWSKSLGKNNFIAYQASSRSGVLIVEFDEKNQRVFLRGRAVAVMEGTLLA